MALFNVIVIGSGAMGSAAAYQLARRGARVLVLEQFEIGHTCGSSHGRSRVIRKAYFEDSRYVPLLHAAYDLWRELERETGTSLLHLAGCLNMGPPDHECIQGVQRSAIEHGLEHELLSAAEIADRWPFTPAPGDVGLFEKDAGFVVPEQCVGLFVKQAQRHGAVIRTHCRVTGWRATDAGVEVATAAGTYSAGKLIITAGPWLGETLGTLSLPLRMERQVQLWFTPMAPRLFMADRMPSFVHFTPEGAYYGIAMRSDEGVKIARHHGGQTTTADAVDRAVTEADVSPVRAYIRRHLPKADGPLVDSAVCLYTNTSDENFIVDFHPTHQPTVIVAGGFSGHGFKFAPVIGAIVADLALVGRTAHAIDFFKFDRFRA